eukprot:37507_1
MRSSPLSRKRKWDALQNNRNPYDTSPPAKRFKPRLTDSESPSISVSPDRDCNSSPDTIMMDPTNDTNKEDPIVKYAWLMNGNCKIVKHKIMEQYYQFLVVDTQEPQLKKLRHRSKWLSHADISHLDCYQTYLKAHQITVEDATSAQYVIHKVLAHEKTLDGLTFEVKWAGYNETTWEPQQNLKNNAAYVRYCKANDIETDDTDVSDYEEVVEEEGVLSDQVSDYEEIDARQEAVMLMQCDKCKKYRIVFDPNQNMNDLNPWECIMNADDCEFEQFTMQYIRQHLSHSQIMQLQRQMIAKHAMNQPQGLTVLSGPILAECMKSETHEQCEYVERVISDIPMILNVHNIEPCIATTKQCIEQIYEFTELQQGYASLSTKEEELLTCALLTITNIQQRLSQCLSDLKQKHDALPQQIMEYSINKHKMSMNEEEHTDSDVIVILSDEEESTESDDIFVPNDDACVSDYEEDTDSNDVFIVNDNHNHKPRRKRKKATSKSKKPSKINVVETAPLNSRYFEEKRNDACLQQENIISDDDKQQIMQQILKKANLTMEDLSLHHVERPKRNLSLESLTQYQIVLILGESGSGKSTLLNELWQHNQECVTFCEPSKLLWHDNNSIISELGNDLFEAGESRTNATNKAMNIMSSIGLNSVPTWLKPYHILSQGEQYRATFARLLSMALHKQNEFIMMDEFSSVLDRQNAKCMSASICKFIRKSNINQIANFILATTNSDIVRYLQPDLLITLGGHDEMALIQNPNNLNDISTYKTDIKVVLDLPPFDELKDHCFGLSQNIKLDALSPRHDAQFALNDKTVRRLQCNVNLDEHTRICDRCFDFSFDGNITTDIPCLQRRHVVLDDDTFSIGIIFGPSGSGKTSTGERLFGRARGVEWNKNLNIAQHFASVHDIEEKMAAVCLHKRLCLSRFDELSDGEQHRINIARQLGRNHVIIDEFTSYLDRKTAQKVARGVSRYIHRHRNHSVVFLACHGDMIEDLNPNWLFDIENRKVIHFVVDDGDMEMADNNSWIEKEHKFIHSSAMWRHAQIKIHLKPANRADFSPKFSKYHYLTSSINTNAKCFTAWASFSDRSDSQIVGFTSCSVYPFHQCMPDDVYRFQYREHRTVILPSYQGLGIGSRISDAIGEYLALQGYRLQSKTAHPRYGRYRDRSPLWNATKANHTQSKRRLWDGRQGDDSRKPKSWYCHVYKLPFQRNAQQEAYLASRLIVKRKYKTHYKAPYDPFG